MKNLIDPEEIHHKKSDDIINNVVAIVVVVAMIAVCWLAFVVFSLVDVVNLL